MKTGNRTVDELSEPLALTDLRPELARFALTMEERLRANEDKGGWQDCSTSWLVRCLRKEAEDLAMALILTEDVVGEAADVANFAMMIADRHGLLEASHR